MNIQKKYLSDNLRWYYQCECGYWITKKSDLCFMNTVDPADTKKIEYISTKNSSLSLFINIPAKEINANYHGRVLRKKYCCNCRAPLPEGVGMTKSIRVVLVGEKSCGKTVTTLVQTDLLRSLFHYPAAQREGISVDLEVFNSEMNQRYTKQLHDFLGGKLPDPNPPLGRSFHIAYKIVNRTLGANFGLLLTDCHGEIGNDTLAPDQGIYDTSLDALFFMIDGEKLVKTPTEATQYNTEYLHNLFASLRRKKVPVYVILTKADCLLSKEDMAKFNSLSKSNTGAYTSKHANGFQNDIYLYNRNLALTFLRQYGQRVLNTLYEYVPEELVFPFMISSYNPHYSVTNYTYFCSEQPILHLLYRMNLYPAA